MERADANKRKKDTDVTIFRVTRRPICWSGNEKVVGTCQAMILPQTQRPPVQQTTINY